MNKYTEYTYTVCVRGGVIGGEGGLKQIKHLPQIPFAGQFCIAFYPSNLSTLHDQSALCQEFAAPKRPCLSTTWTCLSTRKSLCCTCVCFYKSLCCTYVCVYKSLCCTCVCVYKSLCCTSLCVYKSLFCTCMCVYKIFVLPLVNFCLTEPMLNLKLFGPQNIFPVRFETV
jgi:hypothetical protein